MLNQFILVSVQKVRFSEPRRLYEARNWRRGAYLKVRENSDRGFRQIPGGPAKVIGIYIEAYLHFCGYLKGSMSRRFLSYFVIKIGLFELPLLAETTIRKGM